MKRRSHDEVEAARVVNRPASVSELPLFGGAPASAQPARVVEVRSHTRVVDGTKAAEQEARDHEAAFLAFHAANPGIYDELRTRALARLASGAEYIELKELWGVLRREMKQSLNNNHVPFYARLLRENVPELRPLIKTRARKAA